MWYAQVVSILLSKIKEEETELAKIFLDNFFAFIKKRLFDFGDEPHFLLTLGTLDKLFSKFAQRTDNSVSIEEFSGYLLGLTVLYSKFDADYEEKWNIDFCDLLFNPVALIALAIDDEVIANERALNSGERQFNVAKNRSRPEVPEQARTLIINRLEKRVFSELNFDLKINFENLLTIFSQINSPKIISHFFYDYLKVANLSSVFDSFVYQLYLDTSSVFNELIIIEDYEEGFFDALARFSTLIGQKSGVPEKADLFERLQAVLAKIIFANYAYMLDKNSYGYWLFKMTTIHSLLSFETELQQTPEIRVVVYRIVFSTLSMGQFRYCLAEDGNLCTEVERNLMIQLSSFAAFIRKKEQPVPKEVNDSYQALCDALTCYMMNRNIIDYFVFKKICGNSIRSLRKNLINDLKLLERVDRLEYSIHVFEVFYPILKIKGELNEEIKLVNFLVQLLDLVAEVKIEMLEKRELGFSHNSTAMEGFVLSLTKAAIGYFDNKHSFETHTKFIVDFENIILDAKEAKLHKLSQSWATILSGLERLDFSWLTTYQGQEAKVCEEPTAKQAAMYQDRKVQHLLKSISKIYELSIGLNDSALGGLNDDRQAGLLEALAIIIDSSTALYLSSKTKENFRVYKRICVDAIHEIGAMLDYDFETQNLLTAIQAAIENLNEPFIQYYKEGRKQLIFRAKAVQNLELGVQLLHRPS